MFGFLEVNESITYSDSEGNIVTFPSPMVTVDCDVVICPENCKDPVDIVVDGCSDSIEFDAGELCIDGLGRIVQLDVTLNNVCPYKRVALAVLLNEVDDTGTEHKRGMKTMVIPAHSRSSCQDITIRCVRFVLPEELNVSETQNCICNNRNLKARFIAHYIDNDVTCFDCDLEA